MQFRFLYLLAFYLLLFSVAEAKNVTVSFNFPLDSNAVYSDVTETLSLPEDANAFTAFTRLASGRDVALDISYFDFDSDGINESAFINSINGIAATTDFSSYWEFSVNNTSSMVGISDYVPAEGDTLAFDYLQPVLQEGMEWLVDQQGASGKIGYNSFQHAFALMALSTWSDANVQGIPEGKVQDAADYILGLQEADARFEQDNLTTAVALLALLSNGYTLDELEVSSVDPAAALIATQNSDGGFESGTSSSDVDTTAWVMLALVAAKQPLPERSTHSPIDYLYAAQHPSGAWGYNAADPADHFDFTAEALLALEDAGETTKSQTQEGLAWLKSQQGEEGCFQDGFRTALGALVLTAYDAPEAADAMECLETLAHADGSFGRSTNPSNSMDTALAVIALQDKTLPLPPSLPASTPPSDSIGLNTIVKFVVDLENTGLVPVENVQVSLTGFPVGWVIQNGTIRTFAEILPGKTRSAEIYVRLEETGTYAITASVTADQLLSPVLSNTLSGIAILPAQLEATLRFG